MFIELEPKRYEIKVEALFFDMVSKIAYFTS